MSINVIRSILVLLAGGASLASCVYRDLVQPVDCSVREVRVELVEKRDVVGCDEANGMIHVIAPDAVPPLHFIVDNGPGQTQGIFSSLNAGVHAVTVMDGNGCTGSLSVAIENIASTLRLDLVSTSADDNCLSPNGTAEVRVAGGAPPYTLSFNGKPSESTVFIKLNNGAHIVTVTDGLACAYTLTIEVPKGNTGVSWRNDIEPIINRSCAVAGCHVPGTSRVDLTSFDKVKAVAFQVKARTETRSMPFDGSLLDEEIAKIGCWVEDGAPNN